MSSSYFLNLSGNQVLLLFIKADGQDRSTPLQVQPRRLGQINVILVIERVLSRQIRH
jgi:hypothetical protein